MNKHLPSIASQKSELRRHLKSVRSSLDQEEYDRSCKQICEQLESMDVFAGAKWVHAFWPLVDSREPDIRPFIDHLIRSSVRIALPVIRPELKSGKPSKRIRQVEYKQHTTMSQKHWGIHEPDGDQYVSKEAIDVALVPALGVDRDGFRIGYGGGYYDEFLSGMKVTIVCPIFSRCVIETVPRESHDIPVDFVVTETGRIATSKT